VKHIEKANNLLPKYIFYRKNRYIN